MTNFAGIPVMGYDGTGKAIVAIPTNGGNVVTTGNAQKLGSTNPSLYDPNTIWMTLSIDSLFGSSAVGYGLDSSGITTNLFWNGNTGVVGATGLASSPGVNGVNYQSPNWFFAIDTSIQTSPMNYFKGFPISLTIPFTTIAAQADSIVAMGTELVATSASTMGSWVSTTPIPWDHATGEVELVETDYRSTAYTFPGYTGANPQIQRTLAVTNGSNVPTVWDAAVGTTGAQGYYGVIGAPTFTINWST